MSRVYFHSPSGTTELRGAERHQLAWYAGHLTWPILERFTEARFGQTDISPPLLRVVSRSCYLHGTPPEALARLGAFKTWYIVAMDPEAEFLLGDKRVSLFTLQLNTLLKIGDDPLKLAARIHGQCEIYAYVEGPNRRWLAEIMTRGLKTGVYRQNMHWEDVIAFLCERDDEPVVMSYSVCEQFPNPGVAEWMSENQERVLEDESNADEIHEEWYELSTEEQWARAMPKLRGGGVGSGLELKPDGWNDYYFGEGLTAFHVAAHLDALLDAEGRKKGVASNG